MIFLKQLQVIHVSVMLHMLNVVKGTSEFVIEATATQCVQKVIELLL